jgi:hypothetical protein
MGLLPFKCGIDGCKKSKLQKHTHVIGEFRNYNDRALIESYRVWAQMRGEPMSIPGGSSDDMAHYMTSKMKMNRKEARKFRENLEKERKKRR